MKIMKSVLFWTCCFALLVSLSAQAQRASVHANFTAFSFEKVQNLNDTASVKYKGETSFSGNLRLYDKSKWAIRLGVGVNKMKYEISDETQTNFDAVRENLTAIIGLEKHFEIGPLIPYVGVAVPLAFNSKDKFSEIGSNLVEQVKNGSVKAGFGIVAGANIKLFRILRLGAEANVGWNKFKSEVSQIQSLSDFNLNRFDSNIEVTIGVAF